MIFQKNPEVFQKKLPAVVTENMDESRESIKMVEYAQDGFTALKTIKEESKGNGETIREENRFDGINDSKEFDRGVISRPMCINASEYTKI